MLNHRRLAALLACIGVIVAGRGATARDGAFLRAYQIDARVLLPAPPPDGSPQQKAELQELERIQRERTPEEAAAATADDAEEDIFIYRTVLGPSFNAAALPLTAALSRQLASNEPVVVNVGKTYFHRLRPFIVDRGLHPICSGESGSYPSGHTANGYLQGLVLAAIVPEHRDAILARAADYAHNRLVCGVHYSSDLEASKMLAYAMAALIMNNPAFETEFVAAQAEVRRALNVPPSP